MLSPLTSLSGGRLVVGAQPTHASAAKYSTRYVTPNTVQSGTVRPADILLSRRHHLVFIDRGSLAKGHRRVLPLGVTHTRLDRYPQRHAPR